VLVGVREPVNDLLRLLSRCGIVQIGERPPIGALGKDREIRAYRLYILGVERGSDDIIHVCPSAVRRRLRDTRSQVGSPVGATRIKSLTSAIRARR
jgi:hypothetical protein